MWRWVNELLKLKLWYNVLVQWWGYSNKKIVKNKQDSSTVTTDYILDSDKVAYKSNGTNYIHYTYDSEGNLLSLNLNSTE